MIQSVAASRAGWHPQEVAPSGVVVEMQEVNPSERMHEMDSHGSHSGSVSLS